MSKRKKELILNGKGEYDIPVVVAELVTFTVDVGSGQHVIVKPGLILRKLTRNELAA